MTEHAGDDPALLNELGYMQLQTGRIEDARANLEKAARPDMDEELEAKVNHNLELLRNKERKPGEACPETTRVEMRPAEDQDGHYIPGDPEAVFMPENSDALRASWTGDLNEDGHTDLILHHGACGNWGDCMFGVYAGCGGDEYAIVWGPEYAQDVTVGSASDTVDGVSWKRLRLGARNTTAEPSEQFYKETASFDGSKYAK